MTVPNILTSLRIILTFPLVYLLWKQRFDLALTVAIIAGLSDLFDGYIARAFHAESRLGSYLDPLADKLFIVSAYTVLMLIAAIPAWLFYLVIGRDIFLVTGFAILYVRGKRRPQFQPLMIGKVTVAFLIGLAVLSIIDLRYELEMELLPFFIAAAVLCGLSIIFYLAAVWSQLYDRPSSPAS